MDYPISICVRPTADRGVTVNGIGIWPGEPEDERGYTVKIEGNITVSFNFNTGHAESFCYHPKEYPESRFEAVVLYMLASCLVMMGIIIYSLYCWIF